MRLAVTWDGMRHSDNVRHRPLPQSPSSIPPSLMLPVVMWSAATPMLISSRPTSDSEAQKRRYTEASSPTLTLHIRKQLSGDGNAGNCPSGDAMCCVMMGPGSHVTAIPSSSPLQWQPRCCLLRLIWHPALCEDASSQAPEIISLFASLG